MIIYFLLYFSIAILCIFKRRTTSKDLPLFVTLGIVLVLMATYRENIGYSAYYQNDYESYKFQFQHYLEREDIEFLFIIIRNSIRYFTSNVNVFFFFFAVIGISLKLIAIKQLTRFWFFSILIYLSEFYILHDLIQMRAAIASGFLLLSIKPVADRNLKLFLIYATLGSMFHTSGLIIFVLWFLRNSTFNFLIWISIIPIGIFLNQTRLLNLEMFIDFIPSGRVLDSINNYNNGLADGRFDQSYNLLTNKLMLLKIVFYYLILYHIKTIAKHNPYIFTTLKIWGLALFIELSFIFLPVLSGRLSDMLDIVYIITLPCIYYIESLNSTTKTAIILILALSIFYVNSRELLFITKGFY